MAKWKFSKLQSPARFRYPAQMKKFIFVTGMAGSGKSTISKELNLLGYKSYDIEDNEYGLFTMVRRDTGKLYEDYDNTDMEKVKNARWTCDVSKLKEFVNKQTEGIVFYCGISSNNEEVMSLFDVSILLKASSETIYKRLLTREGTEDYGNTEAGRQNALGWKDEFEGKMQKAGMLVVDANSNPREVANKIVELVKSKIV